MTCRPSTDCAPPEGADDDEDVIVNDSAGAAIGDLIAERLNRSRPQNRRSRERGCRRCAARRFHERCGGRGEDRQIRFQL